MSIRKYLVSQVARSAGEIDNSRMVFPAEMFNPIFNKMKKMRENAERGHEVLVRGAEMREHALRTYFVERNAELQRAEGTDDEPMEDFDRVRV